MGANDNGKVRYYDFDENEIVRGAKPVERQEKFGESKAFWKKFEVDLKKIGDSIAVDEEFFEDAQLFYNTIDGFLQQNVALEYERQLAVGNTASNPKETDGILTYALAYEPTPQGIVDASIYDLLVDMKTDIVRTKGSKFRPNVAMMNSTTFNKMRFKKDGENNYVRPPFVSEDGRNVDGLSVVVVDEFPNDSIVVGDSSLATIYQKGGVTLAKGETGDQFVEDMFTLKIRKRALLLVRNLDKAGFRKVTDITAALAILESDPS
jgi:HK97 family phage major capsid protein